MKVSKQVEEFWQEFCEAENLNSQTPFQVWHFGIGREDAEELSDLVLQGKKTATASLVWEYDDKPEDAPITGGYSVVTDFDGNPKVSSEQPSFAFSRSMKLMRNLLLMKAKAIKVWITGAKFTGIIFREDALKLTKYQVLK